MPDATPTAEPTAAPAAPPPSADAPKVEPAKPAAPATPSARDAALRLLKEEIAPAPETKPPEEPKVEPAKPAESETTRTEHVKLARAHSKLVADQAKLKVDREALDQAKEDLEIVKEIRAGKYDRLEKLRGKDWYDEATQQVVAKMHPGSPEAKIGELEQRVKAQERALEDAKKPPELTPEQQQKVTESQEAGKRAFVEGVTKFAGADKRFEHFNKEAEENSRGVLEYLDARVKETGRQPTHDEVVDAMLLAETTLRVREQLRNETKPVTKEKAPERSEQTGQGTPPTNDAKPGNTTLTTELHGAVPVKPAETTADRRAASLALLRASRAAE